ncbi:hypothetical protein [Natronospira bacteriovora]|uniref:Hint domain-containing protein n=1 Tax=Natronospira bacteriovora TaxID=3069753 RepID=A0ABU0W769_9GAMM|nr:hypothetical protein [Natronospira sp. AB-CW4]MDQ2069310.1 hypothetical protein [Natronospira sp. AB-CW4]
MSSSNSRILGGAVLFVGGAVTGNWGVARMGAVLALGGIQESMNADPMPEWDFNQKINARGATEKIGMCLGERRLGGVQIAGRSHYQETLWWGVAHCYTQHGVEAIRDVWIGDERIPHEDIDADGYVIGDSRFAGVVRVWRRTGLETQDEISELVEDGLQGYPGWQTSHKGKGVAYTVVEAVIPESSEAFEKAFPRGWPGHISSLVRGEKCYDPRKDSTNGGSGSNRLNDPATWEYTRNPALQGAHYLTRPVMHCGGGFGADTIIWPSVAAAANRSDEDLEIPDGNGGTTTIPLYRCDLYCDADDHKTNIERIEQTMLGRIREVRGQWVFKAGGYTAPSEVIDQDWLAGEIEVKTARELGEVYNSVTVEHVSPNDNWEFVNSLPFTSAAYEEQDNFQRLPRVIRAEGITNKYRAQYLAIVRARQTRDQKVVALQANYNGLLLEQYDTNTFDLPDTAIGGNTFEMVDHTWSPNEPVSLLFREHSESVWTVTAADLEEMEDIQTPVVPPEEVPPPTNATVTSVADGIEFAVDTPNPLLWDNLRIQIADDSSGSPGTWQDAPLQRSASYHHPDTTGALKWFRARCEAYGSDPSDWTEPVSSQGKTVADGADNTANHTAGRGVNIMPARYSIFSERVLPPHAGARVNANLETYRSLRDISAKYGQRFLYLTKTESDQTSFFWFTPATGDHNIPVSPNTTYIFSAYLNREGSGNGSVRLRWKDDEGSTVFANLSVSASTGSWPRYTATLTTGPNTTEININLRMDADSFTSGGLYLDGVMLEELVGNDETPSEFAFPTVSIGGTALPINDGRLTDMRGMMALLGFNRSPALQNEYPISSVDDGSSVTITVGSHTRRGGSAGTVSYGSGDISGLSYETTYYIYCSDPDYQGGSVAYLATQTVQDVVADDGNVYVGGHVTVGEGGSGGGSPPDCVCVDAWVREDLQAGDVRIGDRLWDVVDGKRIEREVIAVRRSPEPVRCIRLTTERGHQLTLSHATAIKIDGHKGPGRYVPAGALRAGDHTVTIWHNGQIIWDRITAADPDLREYVAHISVGGHEYLAGDIPGRWVLSHNNDEIKP